MNIRNLFFSLLSVFLIACGSGSSSDSEQSQKNSTLYLLNNATYMAVRYNEDSWKQIEDNQTVSIQLANQSDVVSVIYTCRNNENSEFQRLENSELENSEYGIGTISSPHRSFTEIKKFDQRHLKYLINNSGDAASPACVTYIDYIDYSRSSPPLNEKELLLPSGYSFVDIVTNGKNQSNLFHHSRFFCNRLPSNCRPNNGFYYPDVSRSKISFSRYDEAINNISLSALVKDSSDSYFIYERIIDVSNPESIIINSSDLVRTNTFVPKNTGTWLAENDSLGIGSSYNYDDGFSPILRHNDNSILNLCSTGICWQPNSKSRNSRYSYTWRHSSGNGFILNNGFSGNNSRNHPHSGSAIIFSNNLDENILKEPMVLENNTISVTVKSSLETENFEFHAYKNNGSVIPVLGLKMAISIVSSELGPSVLIYSLFKSDIDYNSINIEIPTIDELPGFSESTQFDSINISTPYGGFEFIQSDPMSNVDYSLAIDRINTPLNTPLLLIE